MEILITGGTGSFGTACARTLLERSEAGIPFRDIERLVLFARGEHRHEQVAAELNDPRVRSFVGDVRDHDRLRTAMHGIDVVIHAAALKVVPLCEYNPFEAVQTNILGAQNVTQAAIESGVSKVIGISSDKACSPVNLYGTTKRAAECLFIAANNVTGGLDTRFSVVRYGNVADSAGSVIPRWRALAEKGLPIQVTDGRMSRFWLTMEEAIRFVLTSLEDMRGGEIFIPKIPSFDITMLAVAFKRVYGVSREIIGIRPGEKLHESLISIDEQNVRRLDSCYLIAPAIQFAHQTKYPGTLLPSIEYYSSDANIDWLSMEDLTAYLDTTKC